MSNNSILFEQYHEFVTADKDHPPVWIDPNREDVPDMLKDYKYPVSSWPVVISSETARELSLLTIKLPELLRRLPELYFKNDIKKIANFYFGGNEMVAEFALICHQKNKEVGCRLDMTLTADGFKVLEVNMGSSIGGWQVQSFEPVIRQLHPPLANGLFEARNTQAVYISFLIDNVLQYAGTDKTINIYIEIGDGEDDTSKRKALQFFEELLKKEFRSRGINGKAVIGYLSALTLGSNGHVLHNGERMHAVLVFGLNRKEDKAAGLTALRAFIMDNVYLPDHLGTPMLGDKRNLFLLRTLAEKNVFSAADNALILKHIPWTAMVEARNVIFKGQEHNLQQLLSEQKDGFVIKVARGFQGRNVFVGKFLTQEAWEDVIAKALLQNAFITQELAESLDFMAPGGEEAWQPHKLIWGAFGFGKTYGGVWVRMSPVKTDVGVINSATGAIEAIVYETVSRHQ